MAAGERQEDLPATIKVDLGEMTLRSLGGPGVLIEVDPGIGEVNVNGLSKEGNAFINDTYGESDVTLPIDIAGGIGQINLDVE